MEIINLSFVLKTNFPAWFKNKNNFVKYCIGTEIIVTEFDAYFYVQLNATKIQ